MSKKNLITVFGATGNQGGSVVKSILAHPTLSSTFSIRAITRDPSKPNAQALAKQGVEPVKADMKDVQSLRAAICGSTAVFCVTNYWEDMNAESEFEQGKGVADACLAENVKFLIWSGLDSVMEITGGKLTKMAHFESKARVQQYIESVKGDKLAAAYVHAGFFLINFKSFIHLGDDGTPTLAMPWEAQATMMPAFDTAKDMGVYVAAMLAAGPEKMNGHTIRAFSEWVNPTQIAAAISKAAGRDIKFVEVSEEAFGSSMPAEMREEMTENMMLIRDYSYYGVKGVEADTLKKNEALIGPVKTTSVEEWAKASAPWAW